MGQFYLTKYLFLLLSVYVCYAYSQTHYYIKSLPNDFCPSNTCITLSQFVANSNNHCSSWSGTNISLVFLPGNHSLSGELSLGCANNFSMVKEGQGNETVVIECPSESSRFGISDTIFVSVLGLHFVGCGGNRITQVEQLVIKDCIFKGMEGRGTALVLNEVASVEIFNGSFISNSHGIMFEHPSITQYSSPQHILDYVYLERNPSLTTGGALYVAFSHVSITDSKITQSIAEVGGAIFAHNSSVHITRSTFSHNRASFGGVMVTCDTIIDIDNSIFTGNTAEVVGGVMLTYRDIISISCTKMTNNSAELNVGVIGAYESLFSITQSYFGNNAAKKICGVIGTSSSTFDISATHFINNSASESSVIITFGESLFNITNSQFINNPIRVFVTYNDPTFIITNCGFSNNGMLVINDHSSFSINNCTFTNSSKGVVRINGNSLFNITNSAFTNNRGDFLGGVMFTSGESSLNITGCTFARNGALSGGVFVAGGKSSFKIISSTFTENTVDASGGVISCLGGLFSVYNSSFNFNTANTLGVIYVIQCSMVFVNCTFDHNVGSLFALNSNLTFSGYTKLENGVEPSYKILSQISSQEGGAVTSYQSTVTFSGESSLSNNQARRGGAILAIESTVIMHGELTIANNTATNSSGGGISLYQSYLQIRGNCRVSSNYAVRGGGIHATSSTVSVYQPGTLRFINNIAVNGSGMYLEVNPKLYILKSVPSFNEKLLIFTGNHAEYGGAVYVSDDYNTGACSPNIECFMQTLALYNPTQSIGYQDTMNAHFSGNTATEQGANLFGGLLDRCILSQFSEVYKVHVGIPYMYSGVTYLMYISNIASSSISSLPVRVCFCNREAVPDCSYQPSTVNTEKGETFHVLLAAVDQVNHTVGANISCSLSSSDGGFGEGQQSQPVGRGCTNLTFNVFSPHDSETLILFADGPCDSAVPSISHISIRFLDCACPAGFVKSQSETKCECICDLKLSPYITLCNSTTSSLLRMNTNSWIMYINDTEPPGYLIHPNCPYDYCLPPSSNVSIDLNHPGGVDAQCAHNRRGVLCGACQDNHSLSLGSSRCLHCDSHWLAVHVVILIAAIIAGILLVTAILAFNMTVAVGLINGFIFYANILAVSSAVFFPLSESNFPPAVFVAWLNLDIGLDVCFIGGLDTYTKTWLQLAFPLYIISLVVMIIIVSEYSPKFVTIIGKRDPVATLATLVLLSYTKLLTVVITALSFTNLHYPDGSYETVWLADGNLKYFQGKHIPLVLMALLIIIIGLPFTILLFIWQWLVRAPKWKAFKWTRNTKLNAFIATYHTPYNSKYRYWTGLLLLVRVVLYLTVSVTVSNNPQISLLMTIIMVGGLFLLKGVTGLKVYRKSLAETVDTVLYFNLLALAAFSLYDFKRDIKKQTAVAYISALVTLFLLVSVIFYHVALLVKKDKPAMELNEYPLAPVQPEITCSVIELPKPDQHPPMETNDVEPEVIEYPQLVTPPYQ